MTIVIRPAREGDIPDITNVFNDAVRNSTAMWAKECHTERQRLTWLRLQNKKNYPVFVATDKAGHFLGYSYYCAWMAYSGYRYTVEDSVYVLPGHQRRGIGGALLKALIEHARTHGLHAMVAGIDSHNLPSIKLHHKLNFIKRGTLPQVGRKFDTWLDLVYMTLTLN